MASIRAKTVYILMSLAIFSWVSCPASLIAAEPLNPKILKLIEQLPEISSDQQELKTILVEGFWVQPLITGQGFRINFRFEYTAPDQYSVLMSDALDGSPISYAAKNKILIFMTDQGKILYGENTFAAFELYSQNGTNFANIISTVSASADAAPVKSLVYVDFRSIILSNRDTIIATEGPITRLDFHSKQGTSCVAFLDKKKNYAINRYEVMSKQRDQLIFCIERIAVNETGQARFQRFPELKSVEQISPLGRISE